MGHKGWWPGGVPQPPRNPVTCTAGPQPGALVPIPGTRTVWSGDRRRRLSVAVVLRVTAQEDVGDGRAPLLRRTQQLGL